MGKISIAIWLGRRKLYAVARAVIVLKQAELDGTWGSSTSP